MNSVRIDIRFIMVVLLGVIAGMLAIWKPWISPSKRTLSVTGTATVSKAPDQFVFYPTYQKKASTSQQAASDVSVVGNDVVHHLKDLKVPDTGIKTTVTVGSYYDPAAAVTDPSLNVARPITSSKDYTATYAITITVTDKSLAQTVLDYLSSTPVQYGISPSSSFSTAARAALESEARTKALVDARTKAQSTVQELGATLGSVQSVADLQPGGGPVPLLGTAANTSVKTDTTVPLLESGTDDYTFTTTVTYQIY